MQKKMPSPPLALSEKLAEKFYARTPGTQEREPDPALDALAAAMKYARGKAEQIAAIVEAVEADATITPEARALKIRKTGLKLGQDAATRLDASRESLDAEISKIAAATSAPPPPRDAVTAQLEQEVRARFAAMTEKQRKEALGKALTGSDQLVLGAILRAPAMLSGMGEAELGMTRHQWRKAMHSKEVDRQDRLERALDAADRGGKSLVNFINEIAGDDAVVKAEKSARRAEELVAAAAE